MLDPAKLPEPRNIEELTGHFAWHILNGKCPVAGEVIREIPPGHSKRIFCIAAI
jgi:hypothetical protein